MFSNLSPKLIFAKMHIFTNLLHCGTALLSRGGGKCLSSINYRAVLVENFGVHDDERKFFVSNLYQVPRIGWIKDPSKPNKITRHKTLTFMTN